jgi:hypothetical protein
MLRIADPAEKRERKEPISAPAANGEAKPSNAQPSTNINGPSSHANDA